MTHDKAEIRIAVSLEQEAAPAFELAASLHLPRRPTEARSVIVALPGGGYGRGYYDIEAMGNTDYSQAAYHVARGDIVVAVDPPCFGSSRTTSPETAITHAIVAAAVNGAVREISRGLSSGTLSPGLPPLTALPLVGVGQSLGGYLTILTQARFRTFDAVAILGYSARHQVIRQRTTEGEDQFVRIMSMDRMPASMAEITDWQYPFHMEDVPAALVQEDFGGGFPDRHICPQWGSATGFPHMTLAMLPGAAASDAALIDVPVMLGAGERDTLSDPHLEPGCYPAARDICLHVIPGMAHMHNFATSRAELWRRLDRFIDAVAGDAR